MKACFWHHSAAGSATCGEHIHRAPSFVGYMGDWLDWGDFCVLDLRFRSELRRSPPKIWSYPNRPSFLLGTTPSPRLISPTFLSKHQIFQFPTAYDQLLRFRTHKCHQPHLFHSTRQLNLWRTTPECVYSKAVLSHSYPRSRPASFDNE